MSPLDKGFEPLLSKRHFLLHQEIGESFPFYVEHLAPLLGNNTPSPCLSSGWFPGGTFDKITVLHAILLHIKDGSERVDVASIAVSSVGMKGSSPMVWEKAEMPHIDSNIFRSLSRTCEIAALIDEKLRSNNNFKLVGFRALSSAIPVSPSDFYTIVQIQEEGENTVKSNGSLMS